MTDECENCRSPAARAAVVYPVVPTALGVRLDIAARAYLGVPFLHQGRNPSVGIDCVGLLACAVRDCGLLHLLTHDFTEYDRNPCRGELERRLAAALGRPVRDMRPGDVVTIRSKKQARHVAIVGEYGGGGLSLIHTYNTPARVIEHRLDEKWLEHITATYRVEAL